MNKVIVSDFEMSLWSMVKFIFKWIIASIIAIVFVAVVLAPVAFLLLLIIARAASGG